MNLRLQRSRFRTLLLPLLIAGLGAAILLASLYRPLPSYLVAAKDLVPGEILDASDTELVELNLGALAQNYLTELAPGQAVSEFVAAGEILPKRLVDEYRAANQTLIRILPQTAPAASIKPGSMVALWQVIEVDDQLQSELLVPVAQVVAIIEPDGIFASDLPQLELRLTSSQATNVMMAIAGDVPMFVIPN